MMPKCTVVKVMGSEKHVRSRQRTRKFHEIRGIEKNRGNNKFLETCAISEIF